MYNYYSEYKKYNIKYQKSKNSRQFGGADGGESDSDGDDDSSPEVSPGKMESKCGKFMTPEINQKISQLQLDTGRINMILSSLANKKSAIAGPVLESQSNILDRYASIKKLFKTGTFKSKFQKDCFMWQLSSSIYGTNIGELDKIKEMIIRYPGEYTVTNKPLKIEGGNIVNSDKNYALGTLSLKQFRPLMKDTSYIVNMYNVTFTYPNPSSSAHADEVVTQIVALPIAPLKRSFSEGNISSSPSPGPGPGPSPGSLVPEHVTTVPTVPTVASVSAPVPSLGQSGGTIFNIRSFRYGTPIHVDYDLQTDTLIRKFSNVNAILVSLLDTCKGPCSKADDAKNNESLIAGIEMKKCILHNQTSSATKICFLNMSLNSNSHATESIVRGPVSIGPELNQFLVLLKGWITFYLPTLSAPLLRYVEDILSMDIVGNATNPAYINQFTETFRTFKTDERMHRDVTRYYTICFISLVHHLLSLKGIDIVLLYHCKSGQDRTGTFYAINQMCNYIIASNHDDIINKIKGSTTTADFITNVMKGSFNFMNPEIRKASKYALYVSYIITWISTGVPGIKWGLGSSHIGVGDTENKFSYMVTDNSSSDIANTKNFEGGSSLRGS